MYLLFSIHKLIYSFIFIKFEIIILLLLTFFFFKKKKKNFF